MNIQVQLSDSRVILGMLGSRGPDSGFEEDRESGRHWRPSTAHEHILLVEDDRSIRDVIRGILEEHGYTVTTADNGRQALEKLRLGGMPELIILDLRMPIMDGWQFRATQKVDPVLAGIPVLAISADGSAKAEAIDAAAYLRKPLSTDSLLGAINRILTEAQRKRLLGRLEEAERFAALGRLAASVGHEINNPLAYVSMNLDMLAIQVNRFIAGETNALDDAGVPLMLSECRIGLDRIRDVVKDLQRLSHKATLNRERFSLNALVEESLAMAKNQVQHRAIVRKEYGDVPAVVGDRSALGQVLLNLILNAAQALPEGRADTNEIALKTYMQSNHVTVEVCDTGAGISPEMMPHIFDPFFTTKPIGEGTGLGLAVSFRIVADHSGRIDVDSEVGRGSSFRVVLPTAGSLPEPGVGERKPAPDAESIRARILVIDDLPAIGQTIAAALPEHDVTGVSDASQAFARFEQNETFDVILCDLMMPNLGGRDVLDRLETQWPHLSPSLIFMTGGAFTAESQEFLERSRRRVLIKPFSVEELKTTILIQLQDRLRGRN